MEGREESILTIDLEGREESIERERERGDENGGPILRCRTYCRFFFSLTENVKRRGLGKRSRRFVEVKYAKGTGI